jgi:hypothetical protein
LINTFWLLIKKQDTHQNGFSILPATGNISYQYFTESRRNLQAKKEEALNLMDKGLLGGHNKEIAPMRGSRHRKYIKKGSNPQGLPPAPEQGKPILLDL